MLQSSWNTIFASSQWLSFAVTHDSDCLFIFALVICSSSRCKNETECLPPLVNLWPPLAYFDCTNLHAGSSPAAPGLAACDTAGHWGCCLSAAAPEVLQSVWQETRQSCASPLHQLPARHMTHMSLELMKRGIFMQGTATWGEFSIHCSSQHTLACLLCKVCSSCSNCSVLQLSRIQPHSQQLGHSALLCMSPQYQYEIDARLQHPHSAST